MFWLSFIASFISCFNISYCGSCVKYLPSGGYVLKASSHGSQVLSPNYDMYAHMTTLFESEAWDLCRELGRAKKLDPTLNPSPCKYVCVKQSRSDFMIFNHILVITYNSQVATLSPCWDLLTWVGLETREPRVNRPLFTLESGGLATYMKTHPNSCS